MAGKHRPEGRIFFGRKFEEQSNTEDRGNRMKASDGWKWRGWMAWLGLWLVWSPMVWVFAAPLIWMLGPGMQVARAQSGPATTQVKDTVYRADGSPAQGVLLISWGGFTTAEAVANREIIDEAKFQSGLSKVIDGRVECLNASSWAHLR